MGGFFTEQNNNFIQILNEYMSNLYVEVNNLYNMHFNVVGNKFLTLHTKLQEYYENISLMFDNIAERIKMLGGYPITSLIKIEETSTIKSMISRDFNDKQVLEVLENDFQFLFDYTKDINIHFIKINDFYTSSILTNNLIFFEKKLWMIRNSLK
ncbi:MAG: Dps family protein [Bacilli bacterium]